VDLFDVARGCLRRWYIVLPLLAATAWFSHHVYTSVKPVYYSYAVISMAPPSTRVDVNPDGSPVPRNGLLDVGGAGLIANLAALGLRDPSVVAQVVAAGGKDDYGARMFPVPANSPQLPMVMIDATEPDAASASKTVELALAQADPTLRTLQQQADVPDDQMLKAFVVSPPSEPAGAMPSRTRSTIAIAAAGTGIAIVIAVVVDVLLLRWKARRQKRRQTSVQAVDEPGPAVKDPLPHTDPSPHRDPLPQRDPHRAGPAHGADANFGGVDPAEFYLQKRHAAAEQVPTDGR
jgi:hypothetical protein